MNARTNPIWIRPEGSPYAQELESEYDLAYDNPYGEDFGWKLGAKETIGVAAVGLALAFVANKAENTQVGRNHQIAMLAGGTLLYTLGVVIGANRPAGGFLKG